MHTRTRVHTHTPPQVLEGGAAAAAAPGASFIELQFADSETHRLPAADVKLADILRLIEQKGTEMEMRSVFAEVAHDPLAAAAAAAGGSKGGGGGGRSQ
jgi:hypothetical protein